MAPSGGWRALLSTCWLPNIPSILYLLASYSFCLLPGSVRDTSTPNYLLLGPVWDPSALCFHPLTLFTLYHRMKSCSLPNQEPRGCTAHDMLAPAPTTSQQAATTSPAEKLGAQFWGPTHNRNLMNSKTCSLYRFTHVGPVTHHLGVPSFGAFHHKHRTRPSTLRKQAVSSNHHTADA